MTKNNVGQFQIFFLASEIGLGLCKVYKNRSVLAEVSNSNIHLALVHFPVYNKTGEVIVSSVTTLDIHDISRACRTFGVGTFYVITPLKTQQELVHRLIGHWLEGFGAEYNPTRKEALLKTVVKNNLEEACLLYTSDAADE